MIVDPFEFCECHAGEFYFSSDHCSGQLLQRPRVSVRARSAAAATDPRDHPRRLHCLATLKLFLDATMAVRKLSIEMHDRLTAGAEREAPGFDDPRVHRPNDKVHEAGSMSDHRRRHEPVFGAQGSWIR